MVADCFSDVVYLYGFYLFLLVYGKIKLRQKKTGHAGFSKLFSAEYFIARITEPWDNIAVFI